VFITNLRGKIGKLNLTVRIEKPNSAHVLASASAELEFREDSPEWTDDTVLDTSVRFSALQLPEAGGIGKMRIVEKIRAGHDQGSKPNHQIRS
jgi:hypothetical protein